MDRARATSDTDNNNTVPSNTLHAKRTGHATVTYIYIYICVFFFALCLLGMNRISVLGVKHLICVYKNNKEHTLLINVI